LQHRSHHEEEYIDEKLTKYFYSAITLTVLSICIYMSFVNRIPDIGTIISIGLITGLLISLNNKRIILPKIPNYHFPIIITFHDTEIIKLINFRKEFYLNEKLRKLSSKIWITGMYIEVILSYILPTEIYNSQNIRYYMYFIMEYLLPFYTVIRGLGALVPQFEKFYVFLIIKTKTDIGLSLLWYVMYKNSRSFLQQIQYIQNIIYNLIKQTEKLIVLQYVNSVFTIPIKIIHNQFHILHIFICNNILTSSIIRIIINLQVLIFIMFYDDIKSYYLEYIYLLLYEILLHFNYI
jgi:hypothetical protein